MNGRLLKIYGERNTGTNYLSKLVDLNLEVELLPGVVPKSIMLLQKVLPGKELVRDVYFALTFGRNLGWKHMLVKSITDLEKYGICSDRLSFVTLTKNPYSWLLSLYVRPYHQYYDGNVDFIDFVSSPWKTVGRENLQASLSSPVDLWNRKNASYLSLRQGFPTLNLKFEELLADPVRIMNMIGEAFSYESKSGHFQNYDRSTKGEDKDSDYYRDYYLNERWKDKFAPAAIAVINERLNDQLMDVFAYERLT